MSNFYSPENTADSGELALPLTEIAHLFNDPRIDPFSRSPAEVLGVSGVDHLLPLAIRSRINALKTLATVNIVIRPDQALGARYL